MSINDAPAGGTGGQFSVSELPEKLRVHALARLIGRTSKEVLAALAELGSAARSAQAGVDRKTAEQVVTALLGEQATGAAPEAPATAPESDTTEETAAPETVAAAEAAAGQDTEPAAGGRPAAEQPAADTPAAQTEGPLSPVFAPPAPLFQAPQPDAAPTRGRRRRAAPEPAEAASEAPAEAAAPAEDEGPAKPRRTRRRSAKAEPEAAEETPETPADETGDETGDAETADETDASDEGDDEGAGRRRRRRGRRGRGRGRGDNGEAGEDGEDGEGAEDTSDAADTAEGDAADAESDDSAEDSDADDEDTDEGEAGGSRRRRRRRRRRGAGDTADERGDDDPPNTVTKVRQARDKDARDARDARDSRDSGDDGVQSVRGSTRLEAKRQRRRDGRDAGRRRPPILSEAEFLARRESVERSMVVRQSGPRTEIGVLEDGVLVEHFVADGGNGSSDRSAPASMVGNIYLGRVQNVLPSMEAAFVDIGRGRNAVLYAGEVDWDAAGLNGKARRIEQALSSGDSVLVQVTKDPVGHKGARLTTQISLAGRFLVYVPSGGAAGISRKLPDIERKRLKDMLKEIVPADAGVIIRTASEGVSHEALERDVRRLQAQWEVVKEKSEKTGPKAPKAPALLYEEPDLLVKVVRDQFNEDFSSLTVSGDDAWETVSDYVAHVAPELADRLHRHVGPKDVFAEYRIDEQLLKALDRKVWLPSGGTLVIDRTEAMTVIDVNTGKFTGSGGNLEETVTRNNLEAAEEIVRQLRLRDIGGIIVVDFIDMVLEANRDLVLRRLTECLARDRTRHQVAEVTSLGLVQMTRKRVGGGLLEHFSTPCEHCRGRGVIVSTDGDHVHPVNDSAGGGGGETGGRKRGRRRGEDRHPERAEQQGPNVRSAAAAVAEIVAAARHTTGEAAPAEVADVEDTDTPAGVAGAAAVTEVVETTPAPVADTPEAPTGMDEPDSGRPARRRGRRRAERPAGSSGTAEAVVVTAEGPEETAAAAPEAPASEAAEAAEAAAAEASEAAEAAEAAAAEAAASEAPAEATSAPAAAAGDAAPVATSNGHAPAVPATADTPEVTERTGTEPTDSAGQAEPAGPPGAADAPARPEKRRRVTRSAGAPSTAAEPVVVTAPVPETGSAPAAPDRPEPASDTAVTSRPRRSRRAASRPAGPPSEGDASGTVTVPVTSSVGAGTQDGPAGPTGGDPV
ncbi:translation initiation factor IF-2 N-terminal domain-containing protein [Pseudonocardia halophobica]|uniref:translation initiation factor IF-2 N-terminal domain-containing protein n=1 Tax=Pseudonocardia halophobica TaxID=29401 RepID=UPI003D8B51A7